MAKLNLKRIMTISGMIVAGLVVTGGLVYMAASPSQVGNPPVVEQNASFGALAPGNDNSDLVEESVVETADEGGAIEDGGVTQEIKYVDLEEVSNNNLERLRQREGELEEIYQGNELTQYLGDSDDETVITTPTGSFSNFDSRPAPAAPPTPIAENDEESLVLSSAHESEAEVITPPLTDEELNRMLRNAGVPSDEGVTINEVTIERADLERLDILERSISEIKLSLSNLQDQEPGLAAQETDSIEKAISDIQTDLNGIQDRFSTFEREQNRALAEQLEEQLQAAVDEVTASISERIATLEATATNKATSARSVTRPAVNVAGLYEIVSIESDEAVLKGQNTGRTYRFRQGDALAYGGTLSDINGDSVELSWPHQSITLSIF